jgi:hypothetical protein
MGKLVGVAPIPLSFCSVLPCVNWVLYYLAIWHGRFQDNTNQSGPTDGGCEICGRVEKGDGYLKIVDALAPLVGEEGRGLSVAGLDPGWEQTSLVRLVPVWECHRL